MNSTFYTNFISCILFCADDFTVPFFRFFFVHFLRGKAKICLPLKLLLEILHSMPSPGARLRLNTLLGCGECTSNVNILCLDISIYRYM